MRKLAGVLAVLVCLAVARPALADCYVTGGFGVCQLFTAKSTTGVSPTIHNASMIGHFVPWTTTGSPGSVALELDGSSDGGVTWQPLVSYSGSATAGWFEAGDQWALLRLNLTTLSSGTLSAIYYGNAYFRFGTGSQAATPGSTVTANQGTPNAGGTNSWFVQGPSAAGGNFIGNPFVIAGLNDASSSITVPTVQTNATGMNGAPNVVVDGGISGPTAGNVYAWQIGIDGGSPPTHPNTAVIGGTDGAGAGTSLFHDITVVGDGSIVGGTPNWLGIGGEDATGHFYGLPIAHAAGNTVPSNVVMFGGSNTGAAGGSAEWLRTLAAQNNTKAGTIENFDPSGMQIEDDATVGVTYFSFTASNSCDIGGGSATGTGCTLVGGPGTFSAGDWYRLTCNVDVSYVINTAAGTATTAKSPLWAKDIEKFNLTESGTPHVAVISTSNGNCWITQLRGAP